MVMELEMRTYSGKMKDFGCSIKNSIVAFSNNSVCALFLSKKNFRVEMDKIRPSECAIEINPYLEMRQYIENKQGAKRP